MTAVPTTWSEMRDGFEAQLDDVSKTFEYFFGGFERVRSSLQFAHPLNACHDLTARYALFGHRQEAIHAAERIAPFAREVLASRQPAMNKLARPRFEALAFATLQEALGLDPIPLGDVPALLHKLRVVERLTEEEERKIAWAHLARAQSEGLDDLLLFDVAAAGPPEPDARFAQNVQGMQRQAARALVHGGPAGAALAAWGDYSGLFPRLYAAETATFQELLLAARTVHVVLGGRSSRELFDLLRADVGLDGTNSS